MKYTNCDHECPAHPKVTFEILGPVPPYKPTPETEAAFAKTRELIKEFHKANAEYKKKRKKK